MAYYNLYEGLFVNKDTQIPEYISNQFIYPEFLYKIQAELITRYHDVQPDVLYRMMMFGVLLQIILVKYLQKLEQK